MEEKDLKSLLEAEISDATGFLDDDVTEERRLALEYYLGEAFGNEADGRSQVVSRDVLDSVEQALPTLMKMFTAGDLVAEYEPVGPEDEAGAMQATDYVNHVFLNENDGFRVMYDTFKTALIQKTGIFHWWAEDCEAVKQTSFSGLTEDEVLALVGEDGVEVVSQDADEYGFTDLTIKRRYKEKKIRVASVPPEEFLISKRAVSIQDAAFVAHRRRVLKSDLVAMGYDADVVKDLPPEDDYELTDEYQARWSNDLHDTLDIPGDWTRHEVIITTAYVRCDQDGDGIAELLRVVCAGSSGIKILEDEVWDHVPMAAVCPVPIPHKFFGLSLADMTVDLQLIKSTLLRQMLDNLYLTNSPEREVVEGAVNIKDLLETRVGGIKRVKQAGAIRDLAVPFTAGQSFPMLQYLDDVKEQRTGINKQFTGADAGALQRQSATAANLLFTNAAQRIELIARVFAETGVRELFRGLLKLVVQHSDKEKVFRLRGQWVQVDPRVWNAEMDCRVNVGLGYGNTESKLQQLMTVLNLQIQALTAGGLGMVEPKQIHNTLTKLVELSGLKSVEPYFTDPTQRQQMPQEQQPSPEMMKLQAEMQAKQAEMQAELQLETAKFQAEMQLKQQEMQARLQLEREKMMLEHQRKTTELATEADLEAQKVALNSSVNVGLRDST